MIYLPAFDLRIIAIEQRKTTETFDFTKSSANEVSSELNKLDHNDSSTRVNIKVPKENSNTCDPILTHISNSCISHGVFPDKLKLSDTSPIFKCFDSTATKNYRIVSSEYFEFEKLIQKKLNPFLIKS